MKNEIIKRRKWGCVYYDKPRDAYQASYIGPDGRRHYASQKFAEETNAEVWLVKERDLIETDNWTPPKYRRKMEIDGGISFEKFAWEWLDKLDIRENTKYGFKLKMQSHIIPKFGKLKLNEINTPMVREWHKDMVDRGVGRKAPYDCYNLLKRIMKSACEEDDWGNKLLKRNPCTMTLKQPKSEVEVKIATNAEMQAIYTAMPPKLALVIYIGGVMGLRIGEICGLSRENIDIENRVIKVRKQYQKNHIKRVYKLVDLKTEESKRDVPIPDKLIPLFVEHLDTYVGRPQNSHLFRNAHGGRICTNSLRAEFDKARKIAGRPDLCFHHLRHTAGTNLSANCDIRTTMSILGHSDMEVALGYQHAVDTRRRDAMSKIDEGLFATGAPTDEVQQNTEDLTALKSEIEKLRLLKELQELRKELGVTEIAA